MVRIMKFNELVGYDPINVIDELYQLGNGDINGLVNDLAKTHNYQDKKEIVEDILLTLDDIDGITPDRFNYFQDNLEKYISN